MPRELKKHAIQSFAITVATGQVISFPLVHTSDPNFLKSFNNEEGKSISMTLDSNRTPFPCTHCLCPNFLLGKLAGKFPVRTPDEMKKCFESHQQHLLQGGTKAQGKRDFIDKTSIRLHYVRYFFTLFSKIGNSRKTLSLLQRTYFGILLVAIFTFNSSQTFSINFSWELSQES